MLNKISENIINKYKESQVTENGYSVIDCDLRLDVVKCVEDGDVKSLNTIYDSVRDYFVNNDYTFINLEDGEDNIDIWGAYLEEDKYKEIIANTKKENVFVKAINNA